MRASRSPSAPRNARERVALRRGGPTPPPRRPRSGCNGLLLGLLAVVGLLLLVAAIVTGRARQTLQAIEQVDPRRLVSGNSSANTAPLPNTLNDPFNVLLVGLDRRPDPEEGVRSDTLILVHVNPKGKWVSMLSIPRDSVVAIPHLGQQKINAAYTYGFANASQLYGSGTTPDAGGGALVAETVEAFLKLRVDYIAQVDFRGFERIVNTLGGVLVDVPQPLLDAQYPTDDYGVERVYIPAGLQLMDGRTALRYTRSRHSGSDFDRSRRQQQMLRALLDEVRRRGLLDQADLLPNLAHDVEQSVSTTLPISDFAVLRGLAGLAGALHTDSIAQFSINPNDVGLLREDGSDLYWSPGDVQALVQRALAGPGSSAEVARVQVQNGAGKQGLAGQVTAMLTQRGFTMGQAGDAPAAYAHTTIIDYSGRPQTRQRLADLLGIEGRYVQASPADGAAPAPYGTDIVIVLGDDYNKRWAGSP